MTYDSNASARALDGEGGKRAREGRGWGANRAVDSAGVAGRGAVFAPRLRRLTRHLWVWRLIIAGVQESRSRVPPARGRGNCPRAQRATARHGIYFPAFKRCWRAGVALVANAVVVGVQKPWCRGHRPRCAPAQNGWASLARPIGRPGSPCHTCQWV